MNNYNEIFPRIYYVGYYKCGCASGNIPPDGCLAITCPIHYAPLESRYQHFHWYGGKVQVHYCRLMTNFTIHLL